ncbi:MAG: proline--tRNA ligase [Clostridia bacterium]|nr:proline--tRNA ligase [Clostridia bacterium]
MLQSKLIGETKKEWPNEATIKSHGLLLKGGYVKQMASGIYTLMPLGKKVVSKIENIIREEMVKVDAQEILMPLVATKKLWDMSGRYDSIGSELLRFSDRNKAEMVLSMTHEEATVFSLLNEGKSYQKYPFSVFQIQTKFRDEARPRAGLIRVREFTMKDAYSFHTCEESLSKEYDKFYQAYKTIYKRVGIPEVIAVASDTGMMGGSGAHEFMLLCDAGEDKIVVCKECGYSANMEVATTDKIEEATIEESKIEKIYTPNIKTIEELQEFTGLSADKMGKAVIYQRLDTMETIIVFIRADREVNETKLRNLLGIDDEKLVPKKETDDGIVYGFVGPINLTLTNTTIVYDNSLKEEKCLVFGANEKDYHLTGVHLSRDVNNVTYADVSKIVESDACPICHQKTITISNGIEVGNIFKLGNKYTNMMQMRYLDENGKEQTPIMGCYGIGVGRLMASVMEARATEKQVNWPASIAPFDVHICPIEYQKNEVVKEKTDRIYDELTKLGLEVLLDDRSKSTGVIFADADLVGAPIRVIIGKRNLENDLIEIKIAGEEESKMVSANKVVDYIIKTRETLLKGVN